MVLPTAIYGHSEGFVRNNEYNGTQEDNASAKMEYLQCTARSEDRDNPIYEKGEAIWANKEKKLNIVLHQSKPR